MLRYSSVLRAGCLTGIVFLSGCSTSSTLLQENRAQADRYYDDYYGQPASRSGTQASKAPAGTGQAAGSRLSASDIRPDAPRRYVVQKGDTLWSIAQKYLYKPWFWPEIWDDNQRIRNPHLIYPGDILYFDYDGRQLAQGSGMSMKLSPRIRVDRSGTKMGEPLALLAPFMRWPLVMDGYEINKLPYIVSARDGQTLIPDNATIYIRGLERSRIGERLGIYHPDAYLRDPETGKTLGHQLSHVGTARIDRLDDLSTATILDIKNAVHNGDRLLPVPEQEQQQALRAPIQTPRQKIRGYIAGLYEASYLGADCMIAIINRGKQHGIQPGYILGVYHEGRVLEDKFRFYHGRESKPSGVQLTQLPPEKVSNAIVYSVSDNLSYALIIDSAREVQNGDRIGNP
ncbi:MAG: LysM peptidoglycan-binding domain-containing protein [Thiothrix sp.]|nr:LysM peptidoglycan-binding domain-containing protein [Thiothrix sp.]HPQ94487.1 LysM peptidoglycan-binding domain-containing protein [Thiolinea sp.]